MKKKKWWHRGVQFSCQGSGKCCASRGQYGYVYVTLEDRRRLAQTLGLTTLAFTKRYCQKRNGWFHLKEDSSSLNCVFLKGKRCGVYEGRPTQCRTWPFWPELMGAKAWNRDVVGFCPGVGKGAVVSADRIRAQLQTQVEADKYESP